MFGGAIRRRVLQRAMAVTSATAVISGLLLSAGVSAAGASAVGPCGSAGVFSTDGTTDTCTYDHTGASDFFSRPLDVSTYTVKVYGAQGGSAAQSDFLIRGQGGKGALAQATASDLSLGVYVGHAGSSSVTAGTNPIGSTYGGGAGGSTGTTFYGHAAGGGAASVVVASGYSIVGGGGGGGGATGPGSRGTGGGPGGVGGDPDGTDGEEGGGDCCSQAGTGGTATFDLDGGNGGRGGTPTTAGTGGAGGGGTTNVSFRAGTAGASAVGTNGGAGGGGATDSGFRTQDGGGGGGGVTGGGGGGSGSGSNGFGLSGGSGGGGGGGGASGGPAGVTFTEGVRAGNGQVVITWSIPVASAVGDSFSTPVNIDLVVASPGVLVNDTPSDGTSAKVTDPGHGTVTLASDGSFTYSPETDYTGPDSFTYKTTKAGFLDSAAATVSISVEDNKADLSLGKSCGPTPVGPGQTVSCTLTVTNGGPADAANVVVTDDLPAQLSKVAFGTTDGYTCATQASGPEISCTKASESVGTSTINYTAVVSADTGPGMALTNSAAVASDTVDTDSDDLTATATINTPTCTIDRRTAGSGQTIRGTSGDDVICGSPFADTINAGAGADFVFAGAGNDSVSGKDGPDKIFGGDGKDTLQGDAGDDQVYGGADNDKITTGDGIDLADGRSGTDTCSAETVVRCER